ncbi:amidase [Erythrobacter arachoides]|uniref:Amidase n=1 Tax=Aurantiacibacter arachoides TaxID=1850444 RepID=A0A845A455_9SPHN|nr:amidase [Aurantiacibacter arachoides]MXO92379.1 amidase [Aurantiacibacter arachoides]GGD57638.1 amidase [Aurantiacibacter arachoides]
MGRHTAAALAALLALSLPSLATAQTVAIPPAGERASPPPFDPVAEARTYLARIEAIDDAGPQLNAVIVHNPGAAEEASIVNGASLLAGRTVLVKDNIETREWPTTAGSLALADNMTGRDAPLIARLRQNGGVVLGKTNLSEWANFRSSDSVSGWSAVGGLTRNPHGTDRNACGSSSGSGAAVAAGLSWAAIGTETDGSITCPASVNGVVGFKPSTGLVSGELIVPISASQDTAGPMARSVADAALLLSAIAGPDYGDLERAGGEGDRAFDFTAGLDTASLAGVRIGVLRDRFGGFEPLGQIYEQALDDMRRAGAVLVDVTYADQPAMGRDEFTVLLYEFREGVDAYLAASPAAIPVRSLQDLVDFNAVHALSEMRWFGQDLFAAALATTDRPAYEAARANSLRLAGPEGIDRMLAENDVAFLIAPTRGPAWVSDLVNGDNYRGGIGIGNLAAIAGYPHLTVPMGAVEGLPVGLSFIGAKWSDHRILQAGAAYERARMVPLPEPRLAPWEPAAPTR